MGPDAVILDFGMLILKPAVSLSSFTFIKRLFSSSSLSAVRVGVICISEVTDISPQQTKQQTFCSSFQAGFLILAGVEYWRPASFLVILVEGKKEFERIERGFLCQSWVETSRSCPQSLIPFHSKWLSFRRKVLNGGRARGLWGRDTRRGTGRQAGVPAPTEHSELCPLKGAFPESPGLHPNPTSGNHQHLLLGNKLENFIPPWWPNCTLLINGKIRSHNSVPNTPNTSLNHRRQHACDYGDCRQTQESRRISHLHTVPCDGGHILGSLWQAEEKVSLTQDSSSCKEHFEVMEWKMQDKDKWWLIKCRRRERYLSRTGWCPSNTASITEPFPRVLASFPHFSKGSFFCLLLSPL